jgi:hypothetical protein
MLTKKDFKAIATIIDGNRILIDDYEYICDDVISDLADYLATQVPNFDREEFIAACGV